LVNFTSNPKFEDWPKEFALKLNLNLKKKNGTVLATAFSFLVQMMLLSSPAHAKVIQILHTNDLHASLNTSGAPSASEIEYGGWAQVKALMDTLTKDAKDQGIETVRLDAGDFSEGTISYFSHSGLDVLKVFRQMGYDAATLGNHDWMAGADAMEANYSEAKFPFPILSANVKIDPRLTTLTKEIVPNTQIVRDGVKIGIFGLSTREALYRWITRIDSQKKDLSILPYNDPKHYHDGDDLDEAGIATQQIANLRANNDIVIALTHIGKAADIDLAKHSHGLDLIIGGHSHTIIESYSDHYHDLDGRVIPIVQTGVNGRYVGRILIDVEPNLPPKVTFYELVPVLKVAAADSDTQKLVTKANDAVQKHFTPHLDEVIGQTEGRLISAETMPTAYGQFVVDAMRDATGAQIALDIGAFHGATAQPAGPVTLRNLIEMYPRKFENAQDEGLYVYRAYVPGWLLSLGIKIAMRYGFNLSLSGITYDFEKMNTADFEKLKAKIPEGGQAVSQYSVKRLKVNGKPINLLSNYDLAMPESLLRGAYGISSLLKIIVRHGRSSGVTIWDASAEYLKKIKVIKLLVHSNQQNQSERMVNGIADLERDHAAPGEGEPLPWVNERADFGSAFDALLHEIKTGHLDLKSDPAVTAPLPDDASPLSAQVPTAAAS
jgi:2',3'-cyclic-nucleotide 2'-phosphodiesterase (5'-nucleotidase family)